MYAPTTFGFLYLSGAVDTFSRAVVGWKVAEQLRTELILAAMEMVLGQRSSEETIHPSDRGSQHMSIAFGKRCERVGVRSSTGSFCYDNALCSRPSFATLECERIERECLVSHAEVRVAILTFIESWYNPQRRHSAFNYHAPPVYEKLYQDLLAAASC